MGWKLWTRKRDRTMAQSLAQLQEQTTHISAHLGSIEQQLTRISDRLGSLEQQTAESSGPVGEINEQVRKLSRLQYKIGQDFLGKLEGLGAGLAAVREWQATYTVDSTRLAAYEQRLTYLTEVLLAWLDDLDTLAARLREFGQELWQQLIAKWTSQTLQALQALGLREIKVLGTSFNPQIAECIGTVVRPAATAAQGEHAQEREDQTVEPDSQDPDVEDQAYSRPAVPYEIAEVVKRGFAGEDGSLRRKAHVIVYEEREHEQR